MKLYDKRYDFNFPIVNIPFIYTCSNIQVALAYKVYISQLIRYSELMVPNEEASGSRISSD
jgi:hypothetical protein